MAIEAGRLINRERSVTVAADVSADQLIPLTIATSGVEGIEAYKVGLALGLELGLPEVVRRMREHTNLPIIYDHQKAGNDIPEMDKTFAGVCKKAGVDAVIFFPFSSPITEERWVKAAQDASLRPIVGGHMTVPNFLEKEGGYIANSAPERIYTLGAELGVRDFVVPGNKVEYVKLYRQILEEILGPDNFSLHAPGFIGQGGVISDFALEAGRYWNAIVGSGIYKQPDMRAAAEQITSQIR